MAVQFKVVPFNIDTTKTAGQTQDVTGFGFQPTGYLVLSIGQTGTSDTSTETASSSPFAVVGACDGTNQRVIVGSDQDAATTMTCAKANRSDAVILSVNPSTAAIEGQVAHGSFLADGIRFSYTTQFAAADATHMGAARFHILGWAGITAEVGTWTANAGTGSQTVSYANNTLNAKGILFFTASTSADNTAAATWNHGIGFADVNGNQGVTCFRDGDGQADAVTNRYGYSGECIAFLAADAVNSRWSFTSMNTTGFTVNKLEGAGATLIYYVAFAGVTALVGKTTTVTDTSTVRTATLGTTPRAGIVLSHGTVESTQDTADVEAQHSIGVFSWDGSTLTQGAHACRSTDAAAAADTAKALEHDNVQISMNDSTAGNRGLMRVKQITATSGGQVEFDNNADADTANNLVLYMILGDASATATKGVIVQQPSSTALSGIAFTTQPTVQLQDAGSNNVAQAGVDVVATIATGTGTLGGTTTVATDANGLATFTNLKITGSGSHTITFTPTALTAATSNAIVVALNVDGGVTINDSTGLRNHRRRMASGN